MGLEPDHSECISHFNCRPLNGPLFHLDLVLDENGSHFSTDLDAFKPALVSIFDRGIQATHSVPQMERVKLIYSVTMLIL